MASTKVKIGLTVVLAAGVTAPLVIQHQAGERWRREVAVLRQQNAELERRLLEHPSPPSTLDVQGIQGRPQERDELLRLRAEVGSLRSQLSNLAGARSGTPNAQAPVTGGPEGPRVPAASWANVGLATPRTAYETSALEVEWGFEGGHTKTEPFRLVRVGEDWREPFDASGRALRHFADMLQVEGQVPVAPLEEP